GMALLFSGKNMHVNIDNVIFEQWGQFDISDGSQNGSFWVTNCKFLNNVNSGSVYTGEAFRVRNDLGVTAEDTLILKYNTFLATNAYALCAPIFGYTSYINFSHNSVVSMAKNPLFATAITNGVYDHNIFYAVFAGGQANGEYPWWDGNGVLSAVLDMYLTLPKSDAVLMGIDTTQADWSTKAEAARKLQANDNIYFMPSAITDFYSTWNANYTPDSLNYIHACGWINTQTDSMFNASSNWDDSGNKVDFDPGYGQGITDMIGGTGVTVPSEDGAGLIGYLTAARGSGGAAGTYYSYHQSVPDFSSGNWVPTWPLVAYSSGDLKYSANVTATDGMQYGDPYWFTGTPTGVKQVPAQGPDKFELSNNYPNPFNPSTTIKFSIAKEGNVTLNVYNVMGQLVKSVVNNAYMSQGEHNYIVNMDNFASGVYFYTLRQGSNIITKKMVLLK
ncbi:MAG TPA: T9SS type A sorting domain-containing protein, partial [Ignavibacteriaceae bacterium]|nr:T9SS type A sorting domain-containing protein [Ignavibacteriaceae bacterium]